MDDYWVEYSEKFPKGIIWCEFCRGMVDWPSYSLHVMKCPDPLDCEDA